MSERLIGVINCTSRCIISNGTALTRVPKPRHAWPDVIVCPMCGDTFLKLPADDQKIPAPADARDTGRSA